MLDAPIYSTRLHLWHSFRKQELVVLECLGLLHEVPVTFEVLQSTGIGSTLMAIRIFADTLLVLLVVASNCFVQGSELVLRQRKGAPVFFFTYIYFSIFTVLICIYSFGTKNIYKVVARGV